MAGAVLPYYSAFLIVNKQERLGNTPVYGKGTDLHLPLVFSSPSASADCLFR
jgi:hypothetical protein